MGARAVRVGLPLAILLLLSCAAPTRPPEGGAEAALAEYPPGRPYPGSDFVSVDGYRIHVLRWTPAGSRPVRGKALLVHGFGASVYSWRLLGPALAARGLSVVAADYPPFGYSTASTDEIEGRLAGTPGNRARLLWDLLDSEDRRQEMDAPPGDAGTSQSVGATGWVLVGHSLGGRIAAWMAGMRPSQTAGLVLIAPAVYGAASSPGPLSGPIVRAWLEANLAGMLRDGGRIRSILARAYGRLPTDEETRGYWAPFLRPQEDRNLLAWARSAGEPTGPPLSAIASPTLILWGSEDRVVPPEGPRLAKEIPGSRYVGVPGGSHCLMETQFDQTWAAISEFLAGL